MRLDGIAVHIEWEHPSRVRKTGFDFGCKKPEYHQSWWMHFRCGVRRRRVTPDVKAKGYVADYFNPFVHVRVLGVFMALAFSVSWGTDKPQQPSAPVEQEAGR